ncbi:leucine-rich repeat protein [Hoylesella loescheii]|uniref:leucine-rich repeat domain-containing protein n=1 Tax=Hoylesella loescheii TaxID=840 RepID=UPI0028EC9558|nr:leucine-rich repeat protein [Hoylesella loescheii]
MNTIRLLLLTLFITAMPIKGLAYTSGQIVTLNNLYFKVLSGTEHTLAFIGVNGAAGKNITLPNPVDAGIEGKFKITSVEYVSGYGCGGITKITLPETVTKFGAFCFLWSDLTTLHIPSSVTNIDDAAFCCLTKAPKYTVASGNKNFEADSNGALYLKGKKKLYSVPSNVTLQPGGEYYIDEHVETICIGAIYRVENLKTLIFPKNLKSIAMGMFTIAPTGSIEAFEVASGGSTPFYARGGVLFKGKELVLYPQGKHATHYRVPNDITKIATYAISDNNKLESIDLNNVKTLEGSAIYNAQKLTSITIPRDIKKYNTVTGEGLKEGCFESCPNVEAYHLAPGNGDFYIDQGVLLSKDKTILYSYPPKKQGSTYNIPTTVTKIGMHAFQSAKYITSIFIPASVERIDKEAFRGLSELTTVTFDPNSKVYSLSDLAFRGCGKLKEVTLPKNITWLGAVFFECDNLEVINVPADSKLRHIGGGAFSTNRKLKAFNFKGASKLESIGNDVFAGLTELREFNIPKSVTSIAANAFIGCEKLQKVTFDPDAEIDLIGEGAFSGCGITSIKIPKNVAQIEREAFLRCEALTTIHITKATTHISPEAFKYCSKLTAINVDKDNETYSSIDGYLLSKNKNILKIFPPGKANDKFTLLPPSITEIGDFAFYDCKKLKNVTIPNKVTSIGKRAFGLCSNLNTITFLCDQIIDPSNIKQGVNEESFDDDNSPQKRFSNIHINVRSNKFSDYQGNNFYKRFASITPSFTSGTEEYIAVSDQAVYMLSTNRDVQTFILPTKIPHGAKNYDVSAIGDYAFENAPTSIEEVVVKTNVEYIGAKAFVKKNNKLKSIFFIQSEPTKQMLGTTRFELDETGKNFNEFDPSTKIYVKKSAYIKYKKEWNKTRINTTTKQEEQSPFNFTDQIEYKIKDAQISNRYTTFAREFDVDFSDCTLFGGMKVAAFVSGKIKTGSGDHGEATSHHVRMKSIDLNGGVSDSYGYIPANTGVLLKLFNNSGTSSGNLYYTIGEKDNVIYSISNKIMRGVTVKSQPVNASTSAPIYVLQDGVFRKATSTINDFPAHKAYLTLPSGMAPAKELKLSFDDDETTDIESVTTDEETKDNDVYYNLNGQRVSNPQKGIYIHNGKKVIIK